MIRAMAIALRSGDSVLSFRAFCDVSVLAVIVDRDSKSVGGFWIGSSDRYVP
jgi:hypothetical protein